MAGFIQYGFYHKRFHKWPLRSLWHHLYSIKESLRQPLIVLPEVMDEESGYVGHNIIENPTPQQIGRNERYRAGLVELAERFEVFLLSGLWHSEEGKFVNAAYLFGPGIRPECVHVKGRESRQSTIGQDNDSIGCLICSDCDNQTLWPQFPRDRTAVLAVPAASGVMNPCDLITSLVPEAWVVFANSHKTSWIRGPYPPGDIVSFMAEKQPEQIVICDKSDPNDVRLILSSIG